MNQFATNIDPCEIDKFSNSASEWWNTSGINNSLHILNKARVEYIHNHVCVSSKTVLDIGCGGGILTESLARAKAIVTGIDASNDMINIARQHARASNLEIEYHTKLAENLLPTYVNSFDIITCMEVFEHIPDPASLIATCKALLKPNGHLFISTLNRTPKAYLFAILLAENIIKLMPKNTHSYSNFIRPSEIKHWLKENDLLLKDICGIKYNPLLKQATLDTNVAINYLMYAKPKHE